MTLNPQSRWLDFGVRSAYEMEPDRSTLKRAFCRWLYQSGYLCDLTDIGPLFDAFKSGWMYENAVGWWAEHVAYYASWSLVLK
jgi:hypothetical protein